MADKKINGRQFKVDQVLATDALRLQMRLLKVIGAGIDRLPTILGGVGNSATEEQKAASNAAAVGAFTDIFVSGNADEMTTLIKDVVEMSMIKRPSGVYENVELDADFTQHKSDVIPLVIFVLKEVLGDFFSGALASGNLGSAITKG